MLHLRRSLVLLPLFYFVNTLAVAQYSGYDYGFDVHQLVKRQIGRRSDLVVNETTPDDGIRIRQEIRELEKDQDLWTLYILALSMLQFTDQSYPLSYYSLAGIHGMPHATWGGVNPVPGSEDLGYCAHSSVLFPTWHRPYIALYEQILHGLVQMIASFWNDTERPRYQAAARRFRQPYWDFAAPPPEGESVLPWSVGGSQYVDVDGPNGRQRIANPLYTYYFRPLDPDAFTFGPWNEWTKTLRFPSSTGPDAQSNIALVAMNLDRNRAALAQRIYALFSANDNYTTFSNNVDGSYLDSVESIHDTIHTLVGGYGNDSDPTHPGHMSFIQWSAFDPIFLLHHCNIDRIFAIWQALHPDSWVEPGVSILGTYTTPKGGIVDSTTPLTPFYETANGSFWTSDSVRDHTKFGYTYAELILSSSSSSGGSSNSNNRLALAHSTKKAVNRKYSSFSPASVFLCELRSHGVRQEDGDTDKPASLSSLLAKRLPGKKTKNLPRSLLGSKLFAASTDGSGINYREWTAHVIVGQQAVDQTGTVSLYLPNEAVNGKSNNPRDWPAESFVGTMGVFTTARQQQHPEQGQHPWAQQHANPDTKSPHAVPVSGTVPLTATLMDKLASGRLESLEPEHVVPYLREALRIAVQRPTGKVVSTQLESREAGCGVPGLEIRVLSAVVEAPWSEDELPKWGERRMELVVC